MKMWRRSSGNCERYLNRIRLGLATQAEGGGYLVWIRKDLVWERRIQPEDCFSVDRAQRIEGVPKKLSLSRDILAQGRATYADILRKSVMAGRSMGVVGKSTSVSPVQRGIRGSAGQRCRAAVSTQTDRSTATTSWSPASTEAATVGVAADTTLGARAIQPNSFVSD
jgi:hypothetical protein